MTSQTEKKTSVAKDQTASKTQAKVAQIPAETLATMQVEAEKSVETALKNGRQILDQLVESGSATAEKMATVSQEQFEKVSSLFNDVKDAHQANLDAFFESSRRSMKAVETVSTEITSFGKQSWETSITITKETAQAKNVQDLIDLQSNFFRSNVEGFMAQAEKFSTLLPQLTKDAMDPIAAQTKAVTDKVIKSAA